MKYTVFTTSTSYGSRPKKYAAFTNIEDAILIADRTSLSANFDAISIRCKGWKIWHSDDSTSTAHDDRDLIDLRAAAIEIITKGRRPTVDRDSMSDGTGEFRIDFNENGESVSVYADDYHHAIRILNSINDSRIAA